MKEILDIDERKLHETLSLDERKLHEARQGLNSALVFSKLFAAGIPKEIAREAAMKTDEILTPLLYPKRDEIKKVLK